MIGTTEQFNGLRIAAFESRFAGEMAKLIEKHGGEAYVSPSMREVPLDNNTLAIDFAHRLLTGEIGIVVFLTGVGFRMLLNAVERHVDRQRFLDSLADIITVARGPKPAAAMKEVGLTPTFRVPEPTPGASCFPRWISPWPWRIRRWGCRSTASRTPAWWRDWRLAALE